MHSERNTVLCLSKSMKYIKTIKRMICCLTASFLLVSCKSSEQPTASETVLTTANETPAKTTVAQSQTNESEPQTEETSFSKEQNEKEPNEPEASLEQEDSKESIQSIYDEIIQTVELNSPMILPDDFISNYYGIDVSTLEEYIFSMSETAISAETIVILKVKDEQSTESVTASLQMIIDQRKAEMENYLPEQFQIVEKSSVQVRGNYVYLVISKQADAISRIIQASIE